MFEFLLLFLFFFWFFNRNERRKNKKRSFFKPSLDQVKGIFDSGSPDRMYLDKLISTIFEFYKLLKNK